MRWPSPRWGLLLVLGAAGACMPLGKPPRLLVLWHALDPERGITLARLTEAYMAEHPDTAIYIEVFPGPQELLRRLQQPSERGPDLVLIPAEAAWALQRSGRLLPLRPWLEDPQEGLSAEAREDFLAPLTPVSVPFLRDGLIVYADADRLLESGFPQPPADWEGIRQVCLRGALDLNSDGQPDTAGWVAPREGWVLQGWLAGRSAEARRALVGELRSMVRSGCARLVESPGALRSFLEGETVLLFGPARWLAALERATEAGRLRFRLALAPLPTPPGHTAPVIPGWGWDLAIAAQDPAHQAAAWSFLRWAAGPEAQARWAQEAHAIPVRRSAALRLREAAGSEALEGLVWGWVLAGYQEESPVALDASRRLEEALDLLERGADVQQILAVLQGP